jgi:small subunit ribosomal protein S2
MPYVNARWLGGTLTNWRTISSRIRELENLERQRDEGIFDLLTKKEALNMNREIEKLNKRLGGIRIMTGLPDLLFTVDVAREETAIHEANLLDIPVIAMVDTNCDPTGVDYIIPSNDDAIRAIKLVTSIIADAVLEGRAMRKDEEVEAEVAEEAELAAEVEMRDEDLLGEATLAKLKSGEYDEKSAQAEAESEESEEETEASEAEEDRAEPEAEVEEEAAEEEPETGEAEEEEEKTEAKAAQSAAEGSQAEPDEEAEGEEADQEDESPNDEQEAEGKEA